MDTTTPHHQYEPRSYDLHDLHGISDRTLAMHFKLYEGYVKETNSLTAKIREFLADGKVDQEELPSYSELKRRYGFEYNGMVLHEYYFDNLMTNGSPARLPACSAWPVKLRTPANVR